MTTKLYLASKPAAGTAGIYNHLYIVYDPDGTPDSGDEMIMRGGTQGGIRGNSL